MTDQSSKGPRRGAPKAAGVFDKRVQELREVDTAILELLARRSSMLGREGAWRKARNKPVTDPTLEKQVWAAWEEAARRLDLDPKLLRQLFGMLNFFGHGQGKARTRGGDPYRLSPRPLPVCVDQPGPRSLRLSRMWALMAAATSQPLKLSPVVLNDPLIELVKAMNQAGAHLAWTDETLEAAEAPLAGDQLPLAFEDKLIFAGDDPFTFFALLAQALRGAGRCKFAGGPVLKLLDVGPLNRVLPRLGARLTSLNPHSPGLPVRLECGAGMEDRVDIPLDVPADFAAALALSAWAYPRGLTLRAAADTAAAASLAEAVGVLQACGVDARMDGGTCFVPPAAPRLPLAPDLPLDQVLCVYLLALPAVAGGTVRLTGPSARGLFPAPMVAELRALGLALDFDADAVRSSACAPSAVDGIALSRFPALLPLALVLALAAKRPVRLALPEGHPAADMALELLERLGQRCEFVEGACLLTPGELAWEGSWAAPGPFFTLALALAGYLRPNLAVDNPGELTALWPRFWSLYNALPTGRVPDSPRKGTPTDDAKAQPRRIRVRHSGS